jgi:hypothetical protein
MTIFASPILSISEAMSLLKGSLRLPVACKIGRFEDLKALGSRICNVLSEAKHFNRDINC